MKHECPTEEKKLVSRIVIGLLMMWSSLVLAQTLRFRLGRSQQQEADTVTKRHIVSEIVEAFAMGVQSQKPFLTREELSFQRF